MTDQTKHIDEIKSRLEAVARKESIKSALFGIAVSIIVVLVLNILISLLEWSGLRSVESRTILFYIFGGLSFIGIIYFVFLPLLKSSGIFQNPDYLDIAKRVGNNFPEIKDNLVNTIQLMEDKNNTGYSVSLIEAAFRKVYEKTKRINFSSIINFSELKKSFLAAGIVVVATVVLFAVVPELRGSSFRVFMYDEEFVEAPKFVFEIEPGNLKVTKGADVIIRIHTIGETPSSILLLTQSIEQTSFNDVVLTPDSTGTFVYNENAVKSSFKYYASRDNIFSDVFNVEVINRPGIKEFSVSIKPPAYAKLSEIIQKDNGNIIALPGSKVNLSVKSNKLLKEARLLFDDSSKVFLDAIDRKSASGTFTVAKEGSYKILLKDTSNNFNENPITYTISTLTDEYPNIEIIAPNADIKLSEGDKVPLSAQISDDYGFSKLVLNYRISASVFEEPWNEYKQKEITINKQKEQEVFYVWDLSNMVLAVNDVISYYLEVFDNDNINGPKSTKTKLFNIRVPSLDEMFAEAEETQEAAEQDLSELLKETQELTEELERISNEMKQDNRELTWEEKEKIEKAMQKFEELENKVEEVQESLNDMQQDLQQNNLLSEETLKKYMELQELMDQLNSEEMKEAMNRMQKLLKNMNRNETQQAFEEMQFNEEMFEKSLERTLNLLKRIQIEQKMDELVKRTEDIVEKMEEMMKETESSDLSDEQKRNELTQKQEEVSKNLEKLNEEMNKLNEKMSEFDDMPNQDMQKMLEQMKEQQNRELSEEAKQQMQQMQQMQAMQAQQQLSQNMQNMMEQMQQMQSNMQMQSQMQAVYEMMEAVNNLLSLSQEQEDLKSETKQSLMDSETNSKNTQKQSSIQRNLDRVLKQLSDLSQKTFAVTPEMGKALGQARSQMSEAISSMQNRNSSIAIQRQQGAMKSLNEAASLLKGNMEQMMQGGQGGGMMSMMQQMQQMAQQQISLNQLTQQLNRQGQLSPEQRAQIQRLAQQQEMIQKSLDQLNKEAKESGQSRKLATNLERVLKEMQEVVSGLRTEKIDDDLVQAQERILSKLLDAQRSINERDFDKERESLAGKTFNRESPPEIIFSSEEGKDKLRDELMKAIREGYSKDYEELIKKYYEALQKKELQN